VSHQAQDSQQPQQTQRIQPNPRVVIADDQALMRAGFRMILTADDIDVVGEASNGFEAVEAVRTTRPDVVLMDIRMPQLDGLEATRRILTDPAFTTGDEPPPRVVILTTFDLDRYVYDALTAGAAGFLLKDVTPEQLASAVRLIRTGDALLSPAITRRLVERFAPEHAGPDSHPHAHAHAHAHADTQPSRRTHHNLSTLTARELDVLAQLARGLSNAELAQNFQVSHATVKTHVARILTKLQVRDRVQAVIAAYEAGLVTPSPAADEE
jgi:DNA-binding NarL/FixJ family response regulator